MAARRREPGRRRGRGRGPARRVRGAARRPCSSPCSASCPRGPGSSRLDPLHAGRELLGCRRRERRAPARRGHRARPQDPALALNPVRRVGRAGGRDRRRAPAVAPRAVPRSGRGVPGVGRAAGRAVRRVPARAERRPAPAGDHRPGAVLPARPAAGRRADGGARLGHPGGDARALLASLSGGSAWPCSSSATTSGAVGRSTRWHDAGWSRPSAQGGTPLHPYTRGLQRALRPPWRGPGAPLVGIPARRPRGGGRAVVRPRRDRPRRRGAGDTLALVGRSGAGKSTSRAAWPAWRTPTRARSCSRGGRVAAGGARSCARFRERVQLVLQDSAAALDPLFTRRGDRGRAAGDPRPRRRRPSRRAARSS